MADMGHYSLWTVFNALDLQGPTSIEPMLSHQCELRAGVSNTIANDFSFPTASVTRFKYPARGNRGPVDLFWYDGGFQPALPDELAQDNQTIPAEAMMFVGDKGKILAGFHVENPQLIPAGRMKGIAAPAAAARRGQGAGGGQGQVGSPGLRQWAAACKGGAQSPGNFLNAFPISEAVNLYAVALRAANSPEFQRAGRRILYDAQTMTVTNMASANKYLSREYRQGFDPATI
jgi:hypothetical protein